MNDDILYQERVSSLQTSVLFLILTLIFLLLANWRVYARGVDVLAVIPGIVSLFFLFYTLNYRVLLIRLTSKSLNLKFGIFKWIVPLDNIEDFALDEVPAFKRYGGAGIHFMSVQKRYRASFNFLEYPRVVINFKRKVGPVLDLSFSTRQPDEFIQRICAAKSALPMPTE